MPIRNPIEWGVDQVRLAIYGVESAGRAIGGIMERADAAPPTVKRIEVADLRAALAQGIADFGAYRTDVIFLCIIYPLVGFLLARFAFGSNMIPLLFPLASGFALVGPFVAIGLYEMSRRREQGVGFSLPDAFAVARSPSFGKIAVLGVGLVVFFLIWLAVAQGIYLVTFGPAPPASLIAFIGDVFTTPAGWALIVIGFGVGFVFAVLALSVGVVSFPLLLDHDVTLGTAVMTSVRAVAANPRCMAIWGMIVAAGLVAGSIPIFIGLIYVMPVLGHATWHLYRKVVVVR